ncbi:TBC1 domain family member 5-like isoform X2 [Ptychodera flava]|uniref:TBC1 domain family member 5-like isoform X2 n=2 Tax=Ptychodera flava TaxID=63121 RepID=UPI00396AA609
MTDAKYVTRYDATSYRKLLKMNTIFSCLQGCVDDTDFDTAFSQRFTPAIIMSQKNSVVHSGSGNSLTKEAILSELDKFGQKNGNKNNNETVTNNGESNNEVSGPSQLTDDALNTDATDTKPDSENYEETINSTFTSYCQEWQNLFGSSNYMSIIRSQGFKGNLRSSRFRSVCWRLYLECLPDDQSQWVNKVQESRQKYDDIKQIHVTNPRVQKSEEEVVYHPLSLDEESPWNRFFQDNELRSLIAQDVRRTFPEIEFFQTEDIRTMMVNILFCYARINEDISYKQGMHELLAPLIFVLHCDHQAFLHATEIESLLDVVKELLNPDFIEHDAYAMFSQLMETMEPLYRFGKSEGFFDQGYGKSKILNTAPFATPVEFNPTSPVVNKLTKIQERVLQKYDHELHLHLSQLEIAPQIYGIRWVRLLFGREFPLQDLLVLWDAIFADSITFDLVDYIFVAMLIYIRDRLLLGDYPGCMKLLMRYPPVTDVHYLLNEALYLRKPKDHKKQAPPVYNYTYPSVEPVKVNEKPKEIYQQLAKLQSPVHKFKSSKVSQGISNITKKITYGGKNKSEMKSKVPKSTSTPSISDESDTSVHEKTSKSKTLPARTTMTQMDNMSPSGSKTFNQSVQSETPKKSSIFSRPRSSSKRTKEETELQTQISVLQGQLNDLQSMCQYCASKMGGHINHIQEKLMQQKLENEDEILLGIAGLKQIKDILKGELRFSRNLLETDEEIVINDDHYGKDEELDTFHHADQSSETALAEEDKDKMVIDRSTSQDFIFLDRESESETMSLSSDAIDGCQGDKRKTETEAENRTNTSSENDESEYSMLNSDYSGNNEAESNQDD